MEKPEGKKNPFGRLHRRWGDNIKMHLTEYYGRVWTGIS